MTSAVTAVSAVGAASAPAPVVTVDPMAGVTLGQMLAERANGTISVSGLQAPAILRAGLPGLGRGVTSSLDVPALLQSYGNGRIPAELLTPIGIGQHRLWAPAAEAFKAMRADAAAQGVSISVTDSYRSYDQQVQLAAEKGLYQNGGYGAVPGTSPHGWGLAVDVDVDANGLAWIRANGAKYGFVETTPREPWHWEYRAG